MIYDKTSITKMRETILSPRLFEKKLDFSLSNAAAEDVFQMIPVLANDAVLACWVEVLTACTMNTTIDLGYGSDVDFFGNAMLVESAGKVSPIVTGTLTWDKYEIENKSEQTNELEVESVRFGDQVSVMPSMDCANLSVSAEVMHKDWVAVHLVNNTGGQLNLDGNLSVYVTVNKAPNMHLPLIFTSGDTLDVIANEAITSGIIKVCALIIRK